MSRVGPTTGMRWIWGNCRRQSQTGSYIEPLLLVYLTLCRGIILSFIRREPWKFWKALWERMPATEFYFKESTNQWSLSMEGCVSRMAFRIQISPFLSFLEQLLFPACFSQLQLPPLTAHNGMFSSFSGLCYLFVTTVWYSEEGNALPDPERTDACDSLHTHLHTWSIQHHASFYARGRDPCPPEFTI